MCSMTASINLPIKLQRNFRMVTVEEIGTNAGDSFNIAGVLFQHLFVLLNALIGLTNILIISKIIITY